MNALSFSQKVFFTKIRLRHFLKNWGATSEILHFEGTDGRTNRVKFIGQFHWRGCQCLKSIPLSLNLPNKHLLYIYFKFSNGNTETMCESAESQQTTNKTLERRFWCCSGVITINFENISHTFLVFLLLTSNK